MRKLIQVLSLTSAAMLVAAAPVSTWGFSCPVTPGEACSCSGAKDCNEMRHSGQCKKDASCSGDGANLECFCAAALVKGGQTTGPKKPAAAAAPTVEGAKAP